MKAQREKDLWKIWTEKALEDQDVQHELEDMAFDEEKIYDSFYRDLEFGTGGLRGVIGAGTNRMNIYTVAKATQGYANYLKKRQENPSAAIAYDSRIKSDWFARVAAEVLAANGIKVFIYRQLMPTPSLSYAVRFLKCSGGIVITASHNPAKYNGYKVYGADGGQITSAAAAEILKEINRLDIFRDIRKIEFEEGIKTGKIEYIEDSVITSYIQAVSSETLCGDEVDKSVSIVYTPLNGAGLSCVLRALKENGFSNISIVKEQEQPDGNFPTCPYPNPEIREAMELGIRYAKEQGSDLLLATDPDCDRVGIAVRKGEEYCLLNGNEVGVLLLDYICKRRLEKGLMPEQPLMVKTIVTTDMAKKIAGYYGVEVIEVLTGFKYIGEQIGLLEEKGEEKRYIIGFEESYGYLTGGFVRDKDAVNGSLMICEMFAYYKSKGKNLIEVLEELYERFGYCLTSLHSYQFEGEAGFHKMQDFMKKMRTESPLALGGLKVLAVEDYKEQIRHCQGGHKESITGFPVSNVLKFLLEGESSCVVRPSGTEPKLKLYLSVTGDGRQKAAEQEEKIVKDIEELLNKD